MSEHAELQEKLSLYEEDAISPLRKKQRGANSIDESESAPEHYEWASDYMQWVVGPNKAYMATGVTTSQLPPNSYVIEATQKGLIFQASPFVTDTLIDLGDDAAKRILEGIRKFRVSRENFTKRGILYKRGVLAWGEAGSGKTALVSQLCKELIAEGGLVFICQLPNVTVRGLKIYRQIEPDRPIIVVYEDIEEIVERSGEHDLLSVLDGEHQVDNVINLATTNFPEMLGARIINRPSRFDDVVKVNMPSAGARKIYLTHLAGKDLTESEIDTWVNDTERFGISHLRELVVAVTCLGCRYDETLDRLKSMFKHRKSSPFTDSEIGISSGFGRKAR